MIEKPRMRTGAYWPWITGGVVVCVGLWMMIVLPGPPLQGHDRFGWIAAPCAGFFIGLVAKWITEWQLWMDKDVCKGCGQPNRLKSLFCSGCGMKLR